jgi:hypothetical protein
MTIEAWIAAWLLAVSAFYLLVTCIEWPTRRRHERGSVDLAKINRYRDDAWEPVSHSGKFARHIDRTR